jgi:hypothetical protein
VFTVGSCGTAGLACRPLIDRAAHELRSVIAAAVASLLQLSHTRTTRTPQRGVDLDRQALPRVIIHDVHSTKLPPRAERIGHAAHRPHLVRCQCRRQGPAHRAALLGYSPNRLDWPCFKAIPAGVQYIRVQGCPEYPLADESEESRDSYHESQKCASKFLVCGILI